MIGGTGITSCGGVGIVGGVAITGSGDVGMFNGDGVPRSGGGGRLGEVGVRGCVGAVPDSLGPASLADSAFDVVWPVKILVSQANRFSPDRGAFRPARFQKGLPRGSDIRLSFKNGKHLKRCNAEFSQGARSSQRQRSEVGPFASNRPYELRQAESILGFRGWVAADSVDAGLGFRPGLSGELENSHVWPWPVATIDRPVSGDMSTIRSWPLWKAIHNGHYEKVAVMESSPTRTARHPRTPGQEACWIYS